MTSVKRASRMDQSLPETIKTADFKKLRAQLTERLSALYADARAIEDALGVRSRVLPEAAAPESGNVEARTRATPRPGTIMRRIWDLVLAQPGLDQESIRAALSINAGTAATAIHTMARFGQLRKEGRRGAYKYYAAGR